MTKPEDRRLMPHWEPQETAVQLLRIPGYLRVIGLSKILIGGMVIALVGVVIVMPLMHKDESGMRIVLEKLPVAETTEQPRMINPRFESVDADNQPFTVKAKEAIQKDADSVQLISLEADIALKNGTWLALQAEQGLLQIYKKKLLLQGNVHVFTDEGDEFITPQILVNLDSGDAWGSKEIKGQSQFGTIEGGSFQLSTEFKAIRFSNRVKMVIYPR